MSIPGLLLEVEVDSHQGLDATYMKLTSSARPCSMLPVVGSTRPGLRGILYQGDLHRLAFDPASFHMPGYLSKVKDGTGGGEEEQHERMCSYIEPRPWKGQG